MASSQPSRRHRRDAQAAKEESNPDSRAERNRLRREKSLEKKFTWLFILVVVAITLYLLSRTSVGLTLIHSFSQNPPF